LLFVFPKAKAFWENPKNFFWVGQKAGRFTDSAHSVYPKLKHRAPLLFVFPKAKAFWENPMALSSDF
jgi:hypothetical protein